jgi:molecular chaperone HtpG
METPLPPLLMPSSLSASAADQTELFQVEFAGILPILSESIYTAGPEVFVRELMQNGHDAITARVLEEPGFSGGRIAIEVSPADDGGQSVMIEDNGVGLTLDECRRALSTIAFSTKRMETGSNDASPFVGRFGIGLLSGFLVADEITVISRRAGADETVLWKGCIDGTYSVRIAAEAMAEPGTRVYLRLRPEASIEFDAGEIFEIARKYGRYLPHPIDFRSPHRSALVNDEEPLWAEADGGWELLERGGEIFEVPMLSAFVFESKGAGAKGVAFIQAESCHPTAESVHVAFIKNMLVSDRALDLEPPKAPFLRLVVNSDLLRPNAGRDAVMANDPRLPQLRRDVELALKVHLEALRREQPALCAEVIVGQFRCFGELAAKDGFYLPFLVDFLPVETTLGLMTLSEAFRRHSNRIEYVTDGTEFQRILAKARGEGDCIARVETEAAHRLMELIGSASGSRKVQRIFADEYLARFAHHAGDPSARERLLLELLEKELAPENCVGSFYETDEPNETARLEMGTKESLERYLLSDTNSGASKHLLLNRQHAIISQLVDGAADPELVRTWVRILYQLALLEAREVPTAAETRRFNRSLGNAFTASSLATL